MLFQLLKSIPKTQLVQPQLRLKTKYSRPFYPPIILYCFINLFIFILKNAALNGLHKNSRTDYYTTFCHHWKGKSRIKYVLHFCKFQHSSKIYTVFTYKKLLCAYKDFLILHLGAKLNIKSINLQDRMECPDKHSSSTNLCKKAEPQNANVQ